MLSSTTRPTEIASPPSVMKFSDSPCQSMSSTPVKMLNGIDRAMTTVGRSVLKSPRGTVGLRVTMNRNTTVIAKMNPNIPSR